MCDSVFFLTRTKEIKGDNMDIVDYKERAELAKKNDENIEIPNSTFEHAIFLTDLLLEGANDSVKILTGSLNDNFYFSKMKDVFNTLIDRGVSIQLIVWHKITDNNFLNEFKGKFTIKKAEVEENPEKRVKHFTVVDHKGYRLECTHEPQDENEQNYKVKGTVNFNDPYTARTLEEVFDDVWDKIPS